MSGNISDSDFFDRMHKGYKFIGNCVFASHDISRDSILWAHDRYGGFDQWGWAYLSDLPGREWTLRVYFKKPEHYTEFMLTWS